MCTTDANKCTVWTSNGPCLDGQFCSGGSCQSCPTRCTSGERQCTAKGIIECQVQSSGCSEWVSVGGCNNGELCQEGACIPPCTNECTGGAVACDDQGKPRKCEKVASGCTVWRAAPECEGDNRCVEGVCRSRCYGGEIETCDPGFVCTGLPEGNLCLPGGDPDPVDPGPGTDPGLEDPGTNPGTNPKPGNNASEAGAAGCGCASAQAPLLAGLAPLALGLLRRRRRG
jgi:MYXO-CTERM domain-containing protein